MASVFLSYDHDDAARAAPIAAALEAAGHSVWWDRQIHGGAEYNSEIESAVERADAVVVLWSERSVKSAWVRDEAAEGRDQGKLVPVLLDAVKPPMGFRQYQTIELVGWKPRQRIPKLEQLLSAVGNLRGASLANPGSEPLTAASALQPRSRRIALVAPAIAIALALIVTAVVAFGPFGPDSSQAVAAVAPADSSQLSAEYARDLLAKLGRMQSQRGEQFELAGADQRREANFTFEVAASTDTNETRANLVLRSESGILWSSDFERPLKQTGDLRQQLGFTASQVLRCAIEAHSGGLEKRGQALRSYLSGCAMLAFGDFQNPEELIKLFRAVVVAAPGFKAGWSKLLEVEADAVAKPEQRAVLVSDIREARKLDPTLAAAYYAEMALAPESSYAAVLALADRALDENPDDPLLLFARSTFLDGVGRTSESVNDARRAANLEQTSPVYRTLLVQRLASAGLIDAANRELDECDRLWPGSSLLYDTRFFINARYGDPRVAEKLGEGRDFAPNWTRAQSYLRARLDPSPANVRHVVETMRAAYHSTPEIAEGHFIVVLATFHQDAELLQLLMTMPLKNAIQSRSFLFRPYSRQFSHNPRTLLYAKRVGLLEYWSRSGRWPDFCDDAELPYDCRKEAAKLLA